MARNPADLVDDVIRDLDLLAYTLERPVHDPQRLAADRAAARREIERLRDTLKGVLERL
jgi:hypothetical protein